MKTTLSQPLRCSAVFAAMLVLAGLTRATAQSLISNTDQPIGGIPTVFSGQWVAAPFKTGDDPARLDSITLYEYTDPEPYIPVGSFSVSIWGDHNGQPSAVLAGGGLNGSSTPQGEGFQSYTSATGLSLAANTEYWVVASSDVVEYWAAYNWPSAYSTSYVSASGWEFFDHYASTPDHGTTWNTFGGIANGFGPQLLAINGAIVPEPSTWALLGLGAAGFLLLRQGAGEARRDKGTKEIKGGERGDVLRLPGFRSISHAETIR